MTQSPKTQCAACRSELGPTPVEVTITDPGGSRTLAACSDACARTLKEAKPSDYGTMAIDTDVLRKALQRRRKP